MPPHFDHFAIERTQRQEPPGVIFVKITETGARCFPYGHKSIKGENAPDEETIFEIGSNTKVFVALLFARLEELGFLVLDEPIRNYLPTEQVLPNRNGIELTCRHLLTHTGALPPMPPNFDMQNPLASYKNYSVEELWECLASLELGWDIAVAYVYSNMGYSLLGFIAEQITGSPWDELIQQHICGPLDMHNTATTAQRAAQGPTQNSAQGHYGKNPVGPFELAALAPSGALTSTATDLSLFISHQLGLRTSELASAIAKTQEIQHVESDMVSLGLGWHIQNQRNMYWHRGETVGQTSFIAFDKERCIGTIMLSNAAFSGCCSDLAIAQIDAEASPTENEPHAVLDVSTTKLAQFNGNYAQDPAISFNVIAQQDHLEVTVTGQPGGTMFPVAPRQFETSDQRVFIRFSEDAHTLIIRQHGIDRLATKVSG